MRTLRIFEHMSLDGIIQNTVDDTNFPYNDWTATYRTPAGAATVSAMSGNDFDLLLGRTTYDLWSNFWPKVQSPMADKLNAATKYVATHRPESLEWGAHEGVGPDLVDGVRRIKENGSADLIVWGSSTLTSTLLQHGLVDEVVLLIYPVLLGTGKRLFADGTPACALTLDHTQALPSGIVINTYKAAGPLNT